MAKTIPDPISLLVLPPNLGKVFRALSVHIIRQLTSLLNFRLPF